MSGGALDAVRAALAQATGLSAAAFAADTGFVCQGIAARDVRAAAEALAAARGLPPPPPKIWALETPASLARHLEASDAAPEPRPEAAQADVLFAEMGFRPGLPDAMFYE